ncbi:DUF1543 domain-containing protein [Flavobacterium pallidum]|uniref:DUF1543 domain-containing protein n=2 Tax=Flavobacterium pallidum TaxID=2172098 RepID=A0A2S1SLQ0_9FLAO|nr:DUF1543 domain-containing protein [Flavobacterium pallidum]
MVMLGATPPGRFTEQHDIFFGIGDSLKELVPHMKDFWPEALGKIHIDAWREVRYTDGYAITVVQKQQTKDEKNLFFINLGGYRENEFEEYHYKVLAVAGTLAEASKKSKQTAFYKHFGFKGAESHIDDKFGIDVDDIYKVEDMLPEVFRTQYSLKLTETDATATDELHIGYVKIEKLLKL